MHYKKIITQTLTLLVPSTMALLTVAYAPLAKSANSGPHLEWTEVTPGEAEHLGHAQKKSAQHAHVNVEHPRVSKVQAVKKSSRPHVAVAKAKPEVDTESKSDNSAELTPVRSINSKAIAADFDQEMKNLLLNQPLYVADAPAQKKQTKVSKAKSKTQASKAASAKATPSTEAQSVVLNEEDELQFAEKNAIATATSSSLTDAASEAAMPNPTDPIEQAESPVEPHSASATTTESPADLNETQEQPTATPVAQDSPEHAAPASKTLDDYLPPQAGTSNFSAYGNLPYYTVRGETYHVLQHREHYEGVGMASWYGNDFHKKRTSSGEVYDMNALTAAHKTLPLPSLVRVTNLANQKQVIVKVNDRGPFHSGRIIDLSYGAAKQLGMAEKGVGMVKVETIADNTQDSDSSQETQYFLQLGAFGNKDNAARLVAKAKALFDQPISLLTRKDENGDIYLVKMGPIADYTYAKSLIGRITAQGFSTPMTLTN